MVRNPPPTHLEPLSVRRHLTKKVFADRKLLRKALKDARSTPTASGYLLPRHGLTVGEVCACRLIKKWNIAESEGDGKCDGRV